jgi:hypothetical protein
MFAFLKWLTFDEKAVALALVKQVDDRRLPKPSVQVWLWFAEKGRLTDGWIDWLI